MNRVEEVLAGGRIAWLSGVRRVGKTMLCQSLPDIEYFDCESQRVRLDLDDPEAFWNRLKGKRVVLDEVHRLSNPSEALKIAADHYPSIRVVATGSSTLQASRKFRDTLTGRKLSVWLTPMVQEDALAFGNADLEHRLLAGGLPPLFMSDHLSDDQFEEWISSYWAKDVQELFGLERHWGFRRCVELLLANSGGIFEATTYTTPCELSRPTVRNYLQVMEDTHVVHVIRPFSMHKPSELTKAPKVYGFDTGFICYLRGWGVLRPEDLGHLWEHYILNEIQAQKPHLRVNYWRDKHGHEIDFILAPRGRPPIALEAKWAASSYEERSLMSFRGRYPEGANWVVVTDVDRPFIRRSRGVEWEFLGLTHLIERLQQLPFA